MPRPSFAPVFPRSLESKPHVLASSPSRPLQIAAVRTEAAQEREQLAASAAALAAQLEAAQQEAAGARAGLEAQLAAATLERQRLQDRSNELEDEVRRMSQRAFGGGNSVCRLGRCTLGWSSRPAGCRLAMRAARGASRRSQPPQAFAVTCPSPRPSCSLPVCGLAQRCARQAHPASLRFVRFPCLPRHAGRPPPQLPIPISHA